MRSPLPGWLVIALFGAASVVLAAACGDDDNSNNNSDNTATGGTAGTDGNYVAAVCKALVAYQKGLDKIDADQKLQGDDAKKAKALATPVNAFATALQKAAPPADVKASNDELVTTIKDAAKQLTSGDLSALDQVKQPLDLTTRMKNRLQDAADADKSCDGVELFVLGLPTPTPTRARSVTPSPSVKPSATQPPPTQQPSNYTSDQLAGLLLGTPLSAKNTPAGTSVKSVEAPMLDSGDIDAGEISYLRITLNGPDLADYMFVNVYSTAARAQADLPRYPFSNETSRFTPSSVPGGTCQNFTYGDSSQTNSATACLVQVDNVILTSRSNLKGSGGAGNKALAEQMLAAGTNHLKDVKSAGVKGTGTSSNPLALTGALVATPWPASLNPSGMTLDSQPISALTQSDIDSNEVGEVSLYFKGPDSLDAIYIAVYKSATDAKASFDGWNFDNDTNYILKATPSPSPAPQTPSKCAAVYRNDKKYGFTQCLTVVDNVVIFGNSRLEGNQNGGNLGNASNLLKAGASFLQQVKGR